MIVIIIVVHSYIDEDNMYVHLINITMSFAIVTVQIYQISLCFID